MSWGFLCDHANRPDYPNPKRQQFFKLFLDSDHLSNTFPDGRGPSHSDVKKWFTDYLKKLYQHIKQEFSEGSYADQWNKKVEFVFSVPTTWKSHNVVETYKQ